MTAINYSLQTQGGSRWKRIINKETYFTLKKSCSLISILILCYPKGFWQLPEATKQRNYKQKHFLRTWHGMRFSGGCPSTFVRRICLRPKKLFQFSMLGFSRAPRMFGKGNLGLLGQNENDQNEMTSLPFIRMYLKACSTLSVIW